MPQERVPFSGNKANQKVTLNVKKYMLLTVFATGQQNKNNQSYGKTTEEKSPRPTGHSMCLWYIQKSQPGWKSITREIKCAS